MRILFATDGSERAAHACAILTGLPFGRDTRVRVLITIPDTASSLGADGQAVRLVSRLLEEIGREVEPAARSLAERQTHALQTRGWAIETDVRHGDPAPQILQAVREWPADLLALGSRGLTGLEAFALGSVSRAIAYAAPCPLLLARGFQAPIHRILLATDGTPGGEAAVHFLMRLPIPPAAEVQVVNVLPAYRPFLGLAPTPHEELEQAVREAGTTRRQSAGLLAEGTVRLLASAGKRARPLVLEGDPAEQILRHAEEQAADLIVLGRFGKRGKNDLFIGSVVDRILQHAQCSLLIVPLGAAHDPYGGAHTR